MSSKVDLVHKSNLSFNNSGISEAWVITYSPNGQYVAAGSDNSDVFLWKLTEESNKLHLLPSKDNNVTCLAFSPDSKYLLSASREVGAKILVWDVESKQLTKSIDIPQNDNSAGFMRDTLKFCGETCVLISTTKKIYLFSYPEFKLLFSDNNFYSSMKNVSQAVSCNGELFAYSSGANELTIRDIPGELQARIPTTQTSHPCCFSPDNKYLLVRQLGSLVSWNIEKTIQNWAPVSTVIDPNIDSSDLMCPYRQAGNYTVTANGKTVQIWEFSDNTWKRVYKFESGYRLLDVCFSPDGKYLLTSRLGVYSITGLNFNLTNQPNRQKRLALNEIISKLQQVSQSTKEKEFVQPVLTQIETYQQELKTIDAEILEQEKKETEERRKAGFDQNLKLIRIFNTAQTKLTQNKALIDETVKKFKTDMLAVADAMAEKLLKDLFQASMQGLSS